MIDYIIYGGGPSGIFLSYILLKNNYSVTLIEQDNQLGGCWTTKWINNKYFSEHAPRVLLYNKENPFFRILSLEGFNFDEELTDTYGGFINTNLKLIKFFLSRLSFYDISMLLKSYIMSDYKNMTCTEWFKYNNISFAGQKALTLFSIAVANSPNKLLISELFESSTLPNFKQFKNPNKWINLMESVLLKHNNFTLIKNHKLVRLHKNNNIISHSLIINTKTNITKKIIGKNHILTLPPVAFYEVLKKSQINIYEKDMSQWMEQSYYGSIGFQLHFDHVVPFKDEWCWTCHNDYQTIILPTSNYVSLFSKDTTIKTVWSCTIVDTDKIIKKYGKEINELSLDIIINDVVAYLNVKPTKITIYPGLMKKYIINHSKKYISKDTAFSLSKYGTIESSNNKVINLFTVGPHNK